MLDRNHFTDGKEAGGRSTSWLCREIGIGQPRHPCDGGPLISHADARRSSSFMATMAAAFTSTTTTSPTHASRSAFHPFSPFTPAMAGCSAPSRGFEPDKPLPARFQHLFGDEMPLLPNRSVFAGWKIPDSNKLYRRSGSPGSRAFAPPGAAGRSSGRASATAPDITTETTPELHRSIELDRQRDQSGKRVASPTPIAGQPDPLFSSNREKSLSALTFRIPLVKAFCAPSMAARLAR